MVETNTTLWIFFSASSSMPMRTIPAIIESMTTLYKEVEKLKPELADYVSKSMLLHLRNSSEKECRKLKLNIDDTEPNKMRILVPSAILTLMHKLGLKDTSSLQEITLNIGSEEVHMILKLMISKSMNKVLYAEAGEDMAEFLFSFLTFPLRSILQLLGGNSFMGSLDNLYKTILMNLLLKPSLRRGFHCRSNPLELNEEQYPSSLWCRSYSSDEHNYYIRDTTRGGGFLKGPATFMITNDLVFTPFHSVWTFSFFKSMKVPLDDLEVRTIKVGKEQALRLLNASLLSKSVLTDAFINFDLKSSKQEK
ncbi:hypothetical protein NE237_006022 [Protea cynaroides]|uniref:Uncharacterized protein n=1 Tax=Protea cynaroides TaxID=273540 RepID=A0A9Q0KLK5_9MAGN|nr:hypothetical protein NE237_006022 [Protea cynaroides]